MTDERWDPVDGVCTIGQDGRTREAVCRLNFAEAAVPLAQRVADAIKECEGSVMGERLSEAAKRARAEGLVTSAEYDNLMKELP